jgi:transposase
MHRTRDRPDTGKDRRKEFEKLYFKDGKSVRAAAAQMGVHPSWLQRQAQHWNLPLRTRTDAALNRHSGAERAEVHRLILLLRLRDGMSLRDITTTVSRRRCSICKATVCRILGLYGVTDLGAGLPASREEATRLVDTMMRGETVR